MTRMGVIFPPDQPPERLRAVAQAADRSGLDQLWLWEDCFKESGIATAAAALAWTDRLTVGIGLLPVPLRAQVADRVGEYAEAGATHVALLAVGEADPDLAEYADFVAREVRPLVS